MPTLVLAPAPVSTRGIHPRYPHQYFSLGWKSARNRPKSARNRPHFHWFKRFKYRPRLSLFMSYI